MTRWIGFLMLALGTGCGSSGPGAGSSGVEASSGAGGSESSVAGAGGAEDPAGAGGQNSSGGENPNGGQAGDTTECAAAVGHEQYCALSRQLTLSNAGFADASGDGVVSPGEVVTLRITVTNPGPEFHSLEPGVTFIPGTDAVAALAGPWCGGYALGVGESLELTNDFEFASVQSGTSVSFTALAAMLSGGCDCVDQLDFMVPVE